MTTTTPRAPAREPMSDTERRNRHARSMALYDTSIALSMTATGLGIAGSAWWPLLPVAGLMLGASLLVNRRADRVSPYTGDDKC